MKKKLLLLFLFSLLTACGRHSQNINPTSLNSLENVQEEEPKGSSPDSELSGIRIKALEDTALSLAAQGSLASTSEEINARLDRDRHYLDTLFNFNGMMLSHGVLPPVLVQGDYNVNLADPDTIRVADKSYKIVQQARFVTTPPNWRDYLWMRYSKPEIPARFLLPKNAEERKIWVKAIHTGWDKGIQQAHNIFQQNLARLKRDYQGMIIYRKLLQNHMINAPYVSRTELGVTGDGSDMRINDQVLRITDQPKLQTESSKWKAIVVKEDD
jgi:defect in organelle trafficking protein DotC